MEADDVQLFWESKANSADCNSISQTARYFANGSVDLDNNLPSGFLLSHHSNFGDSTFLFKRGQLWDVQCIHFKTHELNDWCDHKICYFAMTSSSPLCHVTSAVFSSNFYYTNDFTNSRTGKILKVFERWCFYCAISNNNPTNRRWTNGTYLTNCEAAR